MQMNALENRYEATENMNDALDRAKLIGKNDEGEVCVWKGGYGFNVYDAAGDWDELRYFSSGRLPGIENEKERRERAKVRMEEDGFTVFG